MLAAQLEKVQGGLKAMQEWTSLHETVDNNREESNNRRFDEGAVQMQALATSEHLKELKDLLVDPVDGKPKFATAENVAPMLDFWNKAVLSARIVDGGGKWFYRAVVGIAGLLIAFGVISGGLKAFIVGIATWAVRGGK